MTALPECRFCGVLIHEGDHGKTQEDCNLTTARQTFGRWLIVEQQIATARTALQHAEKEIGALDLIDGDLTEEQEQFKAAWDMACSNLCVADAFGAVLVRNTGRESERANAAVAKERALAMKRAEAEQTDEWPEWTKLGTLPGRLPCGCKPENGGAPIRCPRHRDEREIVAKNGVAS